LNNELLIARRFWWKPAAFAIVGLSPLLVA